MYFVCNTVSAMDTCAAQRPKRVGPFGPPFICTFTMYFDEYFMTQ